MDGTIVHLSFEKITKLTPRVPNSTADGEDKETERICFSWNIEHALNAIPRCGEIMHLIMKLMKEKPYFWVHSISYKKKQGLRIITPKELYNSGKVPDALATLECWVLDPPGNRGYTRIIQITDCDFVKKYDPHGHLMYYVLNPKWKTVKPSEVPEYGNLSFFFSRAIRTENEDKARIEHLLHKYGARTSYEVILQNEDIMNHFRKGVEPDGVQSN